MNYLVAGSGISGIGSVKLLLRENENVALYDGNKELDKEEICKKIGKDIDVFLGDFTDELIDYADILVISPGIPIDADFVNKARENNIPIWGEIELAYRFSKGRIIGITGTNGKTTTTTLVGEIIKNYFESAYVVGNIGYPFTEIADETKDESVIAAEISSFQLESTVKFHPVVTAVLNVTPDHLNRHYTMENYTNVKMSITKNQTDKEVCVLNYEDEILRKEAGKLKTKTLFFSSKQILDEGVFIKDEGIVYKFDGAEEEICKISDIKLVGVHNLENVMAAVALTKNVGVSTEVIRDTIKDFKAVEHRIEYVRELNDIIFYNDSKGTNTDASTKAIEAMSRPTVLIAGGYDKGSEYEEWFDSFDGKIKKLVLLGATKDKIAKTAEKKGYTDYVMVDSLEEAVKTAYESCDKGDAVLLSPACASWDMFKSYEQRGELFKEYVNKL